MSKNLKRILILGSNGFLGKNLSLLLSDYDLYYYNRTVNDVKKSNYYDLVINCIGCNRSENEEDFKDSNIHVLEEIFDDLSCCRVEKFVNLSSKQVGNGTLYAKTKEEGELKIAAFCDRYRSEFVNIRLPGVFGPGARPNYNSVIATWCTAAIENLPISIENPSKNITLCHVSSVKNAVVSIIGNQDYHLVCHTYGLGYVAQQIFSYKHYLENIELFVPKNEFERLLFSTFLSYCKPEETLTSLIKHGDARGSFTELFKLGSAGQISVSITPPNTGIRGGHFHSAKVERFFVAQGKAKITNINLVNNQKTTFVLDDKNHRSFLTIPNWYHSVENISDDNLVLIIWANEQFDPEKPDTVQIEGL